MRKAPQNSGFWLSVLLSMALNLEGTVPAWILLALHFILGWSICWFVLALGLWLGHILLRIALIRWIGRCANAPDPPKVNKNPYSAKNP